MRVRHEYVIDGQVLVMQAEHTTPEKAHALAHTWAERRFHRSGLTPIDTQVLYDRTL